MENGLSKANKNGFSQSENNGRKWFFGMFLDLFTETESLHGTQVA